MGMGKQRKYAAKNYTVECMPVFVEKWYVLILGSFYTLCVITATARSQSIWRRLEELQVSILIYSVGFLGLQLIHFLALSPQVMVYSAQIVAEHIAVKSGRSISFMGSG